MRMTEHEDFNEGNTKIGHRLGIMEDLVPARGEIMKLVLNSTFPNGKKLTRDRKQNKKKTSAHHHWHLTEAEGLACDDPLYLGHLDLSWSRGNVAPFVPATCSCKKSGFRIKEPHRGNSFRYYLQSQDGKYTYLTYVRKNNDLGEWVHQMGEWNIFTGNCPKHCKHRVYDADVTQSLKQAKFWRVLNDRDRVGGADDWVGLAEEDAQNNIAVTVKEGADTIMMMGLLSILEHRNELRGWVYDHATKPQSWEDIRGRGGRAISDVYD